MSVLFLLVFFFVSFLIVGLVLLQEGKGGGLTGMSTGMDGVMGAKNPLRRMTAWLFVIFVLLAIGINYYFHRRGDTSIPEAVELPDPFQAVEETIPSSAPLVVPEASDPVLTESVPIEEDIGNAPSEAIAADSAVADGPEPATVAPGVEEAVPAAPEAAAPAQTSVPRQPAGTEAGVDASAVQEPGQEVQVP